jgi:hypothetical protein
MSDTSLVSLKSRAQLTHLLIQMLDFRILLAQLA